MTHLFRFHSLRQGLDVLLDGQVDELVLRLSLDHAGPLAPHHLYGAQNVDLAVETCIERLAITKVWGYNQGRNEVRQRPHVRIWALSEANSLYIAESALDIVGLFDAPILV